MLSTKEQLIAAIRECKGITEIKKLIKEYGDVMWWKGWDAGINHTPPPENSWEEHNPR